MRGYLVRYVTNNGSTRAFSLAHVARFAAMQARWKTRAQHEELLDRWRKAALVFMNRRRYSIAAARFVANKIIGRLDEGRALCRV